MPDDVPAFVARFNLLTTIAPALRKTIEALPLFRFWGKYLCPSTCFVGTTITEYALLPSAQAPGSFIASLQTFRENTCPFLIIKDLPVASPLLDDPANRYADDITLAARKADFLIVEGQALAYVPIDFDDIDSFFYRLSHARRKDIRRKLRSRRELHVETKTSGDPFFQDEAAIDTLYSLYLNVYRQSELQFDLLSREFFSRVLRDPEVNGRIFIYRIGDNIIGFNFCLLTADALIDKLIGFSYPAARDYNLYAVSWFHNLEYALNQKLRLFIAGWTDPEVKRQLGAQFTFTRHAVLIRNPLVRLLLKPLKKYFELDQHWLKSHATTIGP